MSLFSDNIRYLREGRKETQHEMAERLQIKRARYEPYESGKVEPPYDILKKISSHFGISIDLLLSIDIRKYKIDELLKLDDNRIVLPIKVDRNGRNLIEIIPYKARAGYLTGYADPEYIESLQQISLPFLGPGKHRAFPVGGDSMPPHTDSSFIVGRYVENLGEIKKNKTYILITLNEGITYKRLNDKSAESLLVEPDNVIYNPYEIKLSDILEIWEYVAHIGRNDSKPEALSGESVNGMFLELKKEIIDLKKGMGKG
ncbi:MAG: XRE family transcriptional regulator [Flavobacterium sp. BFFFF1]|uniref:XRE family transcriptional regulator n=1 Tax=unclassified Flavobacterium TaxID=196869 RepID=UPI000BCFCA53|nr:MULTISPECIES: helix-turn-helix transcriptional regulator [unclassified Flavobacterium]OYU80558.1 MAG: XRE family transcriptional regulator [Flavobacterium sp. BFFFF1]